MRDFLTGTGDTLIYYVILASAALGSRILVKINDEVFRKILHCILLGSLLVYVFCFDIWWHAVLSCLIFAAVVYPILHYFEHFSRYSETVTERKKGELKNSLIVVFTMFAVVITVCWGLLEDKLLVLATVYAWGFGDAAAALIGKRFGKHKIPGTKKSYEGSFSMFALSFLSVFVILMFRGGMQAYACALTAALVAAATAATELYTPGGYDTISCPFCAMAIMLPLVHLFGGGI